LQTPTQQSLDNHLHKSATTPAHYALVKQSAVMPISKKDRIHREQKKAEAAGTRVPINPNGTPVKPKKEMSICAFCRKDLPRDNKKILEQHADTHAAAWTKEKCWPNDFQ